MDQQDMLVRMKILAALSSDELLRKQLEEAERQELPEDILTVLRKEFWRRGLAVPQIDHQPRQD